MEILVTGANGFIGRALCAEATRRGIAVIGTVRVKESAVAGVRNKIVSCIDGGTDWGEALVESDVVVHLASRVHVVCESSGDPLHEFRKVNVDGSVNLARSAARAGVRRFVFVSSIGVNGDESGRKPFTAQDPVAPHSPYAVSKYEAELALREVAADTGMELVVIRPPLVYGPNAPGNFGSLVRWLRRGIPLPLGAIDNQRSLVCLDNLVDLILMCVTHPAAAGHTFLVSDGEDVSTTELLHRVGQAIGRSARLIPIPASWLRAMASLAGKQDVARRLCGTLQVDIEETRRQLGWQPPFTMEHGLRKVAEGQE